MNKLGKTLLCALVLTVSKLAVSNSVENKLPAIPVSSFGVWDSNDGSDFDPSTPKYDFIKGNAANIKWKDLNPKLGVYNFKPMQDAIDLALERNQHIFLSIGVGPDAPDWIYENGVPVVLTDDKEHPWDKYPHYSDADYIKYQDDLIKEFGKFLESQSPEKRKVITFIQVKTGCTGDEVAYKGNLLDKKYEIHKSSIEWLNFRLHTFDAFKNAFLNDRIQVPLLFNSISEEDNPAEWRWIMENIRSNFGFKGSAYVRGHHLNDEKSFTDNWKKYSINPQELALFSRSEMDQSYRKPVFMVNQDIGFYWGAITGLNYGLSIWNFSKGALKLAAENESITDSLKFFNKYATEIYPSTATKAFIALHEGLDAADTVKFPEAIYGKANRSNLDRYTKIANSEIYKSRGARMDDLKSAPLGQVAQRDKQSGYNDVGFDIWPTNYSRFITQVNPEAESIGLFRVGGDISQSTPKYSRFARAFHSSTNKNAMYFNLHEDFFKIPAKSMKVTVTYYDNTAGSKWNFQYGGKKGMESVKEITGVGDKTWKKVEFIISDSEMRKTGPNGSQFALVNSDRIDDIFHMVEVEKLN